MEATLWIVMSDEDNQNTVIGVYSTAEKANKVSKEYNRLNDNQSFVIVRTLDEED